MNILISFHDSQARVAPLDYLGSEAFTAYRSACSGSGCSNKKVSEDKWDTLIRIDFLPSLIDRLRGAGFSVHVSPELAAAGAARARQIALDRSQAHKRLSAMDCRPYPYQEVGIKVLAAHESFLLADDMGLGKTIQALLALPEHAAALVVCPAVVKRNWANECLKWRPDLEAHVLDRFAWPMPGVLAVINYDRIPRLSEDKEGRPAKATETCLDDLLPPPPVVCLIFDEVHYLKSNSKIGRVARGRALARAVRAAGGRTWGLSGTPMSNNPMDLLHVLQALDLLKDSFASYPNFLRLMSAKKKYWGGFSWGQAKPEAVEALKRVMLRRLREEVLPDLPTITYQDIEVDVSKKALKASAEAQLALLEGRVNLERVIDGTESLGPASESVFHARRLLAEAKIPVMLDIVREYQEEVEPLVVFSAHRAPIEALMTVKGCQIILGDTPPEVRAERVRAFQAGEFLTIGGGIQSAGVGITLTRAAHALEVDLSWCPSDNAQAEARICRIGQDRGILVKRLIAPGTLDEQVAAILSRKQQAIDKVVNAAAEKPEEVDLDRLANLGGI